MYTEGKILQLFLFVTCEFLLMTQLSAKKPLEQFFQYLRLWFDSNLFCDLYYSNKVFKKSRSLWSVKFNSSLAWLIKFNGGDNVQSCC